MKFAGFVKCTLIILFITLFNPISSLAQIEHGGNPFALEHGLSIDILQESQAVFPLSYEQEEKRQFHQQRETPPGEAMHAGFYLPASIDPLHDGTWETHGDSLRVWQKLIQSPGATGIGLIFEDFELSENAKIFIYNPSLTYIIGSFTYKNNNAYRLLSSQLIPGDELIVEYSEPISSGQEVMQSSSFKITDVHHVSQGLVDLGDTRNLGNAGPCHVNVNCSEGDLWQRQKRGVARMLMRVGNSSFWCSGSLVNNTNQDGMPYFLSAYHCGSNASAEDMLVWQFYFNFERPSCFNIGEPAHNVLYGAYLMSQGPLLHGSDFKLLLLQQEPPIQWRPYFNGWDRLDIASDAGVGIHHPGGDAKKISTYDQTVTSASPVVSGNQMADHSTWRVTWKETENGHGVTQGGSSGSPLFNEQGLIVGTLTGGSSNCNNTGNPDFYGKMSFHWDQNSEYMNEQVKWFLDPGMTGLTEIGGYDPYIEDFPPPGFVSTSAISNDEVEIKWLKPGQSPNKPGWHSYANTFVNHTTLGAERATVFDAHALGISYPITVTKLAHVFFQNPANPWPSKDFRYKIYEQTGTSLVYQSPVLEAESLEENIYVLEEPITFENKFYVVVDPTHPGNAPASTYQFMNFGNAVSYHGGPDNWTIAGNNNHQFAYLTKIYVEDHSSPKGESKISSTFALCEEPVAENRWANTVLEYYLFKNDELLHTTEAQEDGALSFVDDTGHSGNAYDTYHVRALYPEGILSAPSNTAYLFKADFCDVLVDVFPYTETFTSNEVPECWTNESDHEGWVISDFLEVNGNEILPQTGEHFAYVLHQDEEAGGHWLISPPYNISALERPALSFWFNVTASSASHGKLSLYISAGDGSFNKVWDATEHPQLWSATTYSWLRIVEDMGNYLSDDFRIAFHVEGQEDYFAAIDNIRIMDASHKVYRLNLFAEPEHTGEVHGAGRFIEGQKVSVRATPKGGYNFHYWSDAEGMVSNRKEYAFIMPDAEYTLNAFFDPGVPSSITGEAHAAENVITAFPNPTKGLVNMLFKKDMQDVSIQLVDVKGNTLLQKTEKHLPVNSTLTIDLQQFRDGMYYLVIRSNLQQQVIPVSLSR